MNFQLNNFDYFIQHLLEILFKIPYKYVKNGFAFAEI